jgi:hypothetical protein
MIDLSLSSMPPPETSHRCPIERPELLKLAVLRGVQMRAAEWRGKRRSPETELRDQESSGSIEGEGIWAR